jgi:hypothetical protein
MTKYDPAIIQLHADKLYSEANIIIVIWITVGILSGFLAGFLLSVFLLKDLISPVIPIIFVGVLFGFFGYKIGTGFAFALKLKAQIALCQVKIEENTRRILSSVPELVSQTRRQLGAWRASYRKSALGRAEDFTTVARRKDPAQTVF